MSAARSRTPLAVVAGALLAFALTGCGGQEPDPAAESTFLAMLHSGDSQNMTGPQWTDAQLLQLGYVACENLPTGEATAVRAVEGASRAFGEQMPDTTSLPVVNFAGNHLCPS